MGDDPKGRDWKHEAYQDLAHPWTSQLGDVAGDIVAKALAPVRFMLWGVEQIAAEVGPMLKVALGKVPPERLIPPSPAVVVPAVLALSYTGHQAPLNEMFANLIASSMDSQACHVAHPAFVSILKEMLPVEARLVGALTPGFHKKIYLQIRASIFSGSTTSHLMPLFAEHDDLVELEVKVRADQCLTSLTRAGLVVVAGDDDVFLAEPLTAEALPRIHEQLRTALDFARVPGIQERARVSIQGIMEMAGSPSYAGDSVPELRCSFASTVRLTEFGVMFRSACVVGPS